MVSSRRNSRKLGNADRKTGISLGNRKGPMVGMMPRRNGPLIGARAVLAVSVTASSGGKRGPGALDQVETEGREDNVPSGRAIEDLRVELALQCQDAGRTAWTA